MTMKLDELIDTLAADLTPVKPIKPRNGVALTLTAAFAAALGVIAWFGARGDIMAGAPDPIVVVRALLLVLLGLATSFAANNAARPAVGQGHNGWLWALAAAGVVPAAALLLYLYHRIYGMPFAPGDLDFHYAPYCLGISIAGAALIGAVQTLWLRRGAPTDVDRAGWLVGLAAGSLGTLAYSLHCPSNSIFYVGIFYCLAVGVCAGLGRLIVPRLIRW
jgi:hypothetical protein